MSRRNISYVKLANTKVFLDHLSIYQLCHSRGSNDGAVVFTKSATALKFKNPNFPIFDCFSLKFAVCLKLPIRNHKVQLFSIKV